MNEVPPSEDPAEDADGLYRRASALDSSRPSESVRRKVLEHAAQLAAERAGTHRPAKIDSAKIGAARRAANRISWRPAIFGTLAAAALAGLLITPNFFPPPRPDTASLPAPAALPTPAASPAAAPPGMAAEALVPPARTEEPARYTADNQPAAAPAAHAQVPVQSMLKPRATARNAAPAGPIVSPAGVAADLAAKNATAEMQEATSAQGATAASAGPESDALGGRSRASGVNALSAAPAPAPAPAASAARSIDLGMQLRHAAEIGDVPQLQTLLGRQPVIDARDELGRTALMLATLQGQARAVDVLLAHGANPNAADARGNTPLQTAEAGGQPAIAAALKRAGAR